MGFACIEDALGTGAPVLEECGAVQHLRHHGVIRIGVVLRAALEYDYPRIIILNR